MINGGNGKHSDVDSYPASKMRGCPVDKAKAILNSYIKNITKVDQISQRFFKVTSGNYQFGLKMSNLNKKSVEKWLHVYQQARHKELLNILPVHLSTKGRLFEESNSSIYYLTPWIDEMDVSKKQEIENIYACIGSIHKKTARSHTINVKSLQKQFTLFKENNRIQMLTLMEHIKQFEANHYMSPFELLVCTQLHKLEQVNYELGQRIEALIDISEEQMEWRDCLCHGSLKYSHILHSDRSYLINWEKAHIDNPVMDLQLFYKNCIRYYDHSGNDLIDSFNVYHAKNPLTKNEINLLEIYLLDPTAYFDKINQYKSNTTNKLMIQQIKELLHVFRRMEFALHWIENKKVNENEIHDEKNL